MTKGTVHPVLFLWENKMAKDDYYTIVAKILIFLYKSVQGKEKREVTEYIAAGTEDFPINEDFLKYVIEKMQEQGFVERVYISKTMGGAIYEVDISRMRITPAGIDYMIENSTLRKVMGTLKEAGGVMGLLSPLM